MPFDEHLAAFVRRQNKPVLLAVNKVDGLEREDAMLAEFHALGLPMLAVFGRARTQPPGAGGGAWRPAA